MIDGNDRRRQRCSFDIGRTIGLSEADGSHDDLLQNNIMMDIMTE